MLSLLRQLSDYLPQSWRGQLAELTGKLENGLQAGARAENLELLQGQILPYLGSYIKRYHDMGTARTLLGMLMLHMARYENGAEEGSCWRSGSWAAMEIPWPVSISWTIRRCGSCSGRTSLPRPPRRIHLRSSWPGRRSGRCRRIRHGPAGGVSGDRAVHAAQ